MKETESVTSEVQVKQLEAKFAAQKKQLEHSTEVARESEATASRLADQNRVLKEEIRRLEKNQVGICSIILAISRRCVKQVADFISAPGNAGPEKRRSVRSGRPGNQNQDLSHRWCCVHHTNPPLIVASL